MKCIYINYYYNQLHGFLTAAMMTALIRCDDPECRPLATVPLGCCSECRRRSVEPTCCMDDQNAYASVHWDRSWNVLQLPAASRRDGLGFGYPVSLCDRSASCAFSQSYDRKVRSSRNFWTKSYQRIPRIWRCHLWWKASSLLRSSFKSVRDSAP